MDGFRWHVMKPLRSRHAAGATLGDMLVFLATLSLAAALLYPVWSARSFGSRVAEAVADIEALGAAARSSRDRTGRWPDSTPPGQAPDELAGLAGEDGLFARTGYTLGWTSWNVVDSVETVSTDPPPVDAPPDSVGPVLAPVVRTIGAVTMHTGDENLLAEVLSHQPDGGSFVLDTMLVVVLPERAQPTGTFR